MSGEVRPGARAIATARVLTGTLTGLAVVALLLGVLHWFYGGVHVAGVHWFNLDEERNVPTWFSGVLFGMLGAVAVAAHYCERRSNRDGEPCFRLPWLWLVVAAVGFGRSFDEITVLHENFPWREAREISAGFATPWRYVTQWQLVFGPAIVLALGFLAAFIVGRVQMNRRARAAAFAGVACWIGAIFLEGMRAGLEPDGSYAVAVVVEAEFEMLGAILLLGAMAFHVAAIAGVLAPASRRAIAAAPLFGARALEAVGAVAALLLISALTIYSVADPLAGSGAPIARLGREALEEAGIDATEQAVDGVRARPEDTAAVAAHSERGASDIVWFDDLAQPLPRDLTGNAGMESLLRWALQQPGGAAGTLPKSVRDDRAPRLVFLAAGDGMTETPVYIGRGAGVLAAIADADRQARAGAREPSSMRWRRLDVVATVTAVPPEERATTRLRLRHRVEGIAFETGSDVALSPGELVGERLIDREGILVWMRVLQYLRGRRPASVATRLRPAYRFTTVSAASEEARVVALEHGLPITGHENPAALLDAARLGARYLTNALDAEGRFTYRYQADTGTVPSGYSIVRHAGTLYSLLEVYEVTRDAETLAAAERALGFLLRQAKPIGSTAPTDAKPGAGPDRAAIVEGGEVKLGGNALTVVALAKHAAVTGRREHIPTAVALADWMLAAQTGDGRFAIHQQTYPGGHTMGFVSEYYPGEAILALVRLHALLPGQGSAAWLDAADRGARWLITVRDADAPDDALPHDHWLLYALNELYRLRPDPIFLAHTRRLVRVIIASQHRQAVAPEWRGGYYEPPRTTPTATRSEGLAAAYALLRDHGPASGSATSGGAGTREDELARIREALHLGIGFQLRTQLVPATAIHLPQPGRALGGFHNALDDYEVRIDYVQHNLSSLLALARILQGRSGTAPVSEPLGATP